MENATIDVDLADYETILGHSGRVDGLSKELCKDDAARYIMDNLGDSLASAKGVLIVFEINKNMSIESISAITEDIYPLIYEDADVILGTKINNDLSDNDIKFRLLLTGL